MSQEIHINPQHLNLILDGLYRICTILEEIKELTLDTKYATQEIQRTNERLTETQTYPRKVTIIDVPETQGNQW